jgi:hypothetical protein
MGQSSLSDRGRMSFAVKVITNRAPWGTTSSTVIVPP